LSRFALLCWRQLVAVHVASCVERPCGACHPVLSRVLRPVLRQDMQGPWQGKAGCTPCVRLLLAGRAGTRHDTACLLQCVAVSCGPCVGVVVSVEHRCMPVWCISAAAPVQHAIAIARSALLENFITLHYCLGMASSLT
jgi:hypothetical protein